MPTTIKLTPAQAGILDLYISGSETLDAAIERGVTWTPRKLVVPDDPDARENIAGFISLRAEIVQDWSDFESFPERRASEALYRKARAAGLPV